MSPTYAGPPLDFELDPEEDADDFDELSELASEVELFEQPVTEKAAIKLIRIKTRNVDMAVNSLWFLRAWRSAEKAGLAGART